MPFTLVPVVAAVRFGDVAIRVVELPLAARRARVVARRRRRVHAELRHQAHLHVVVVEVAADAELRQLQLARSEDFARPADRVVLRMVEAVRERRVGAELAGEELGVHRRFLGARVAREPREIGKAERIRLLGRGRLRRRIERHRLRRRGLSLRERGARYAKGEGRDDETHKARGHGCSFFQPSTVLAKGLKGRVRVRKEPVRSNGRGYFPNRDIPKPRLPSASFNARRRSSQAATSAGF